MGSSDEANLAFAALIGGSTNLLTFVAIYIPSTGLAYDGMQDIPYSIVLPGNALMKKWFANQH